MVEGGYPKSRQVLISCVSDSVLSYLVVFVELLILLIREVVTCEGHFRGPECKLRVGSVQKWAVRWALGCET